jgi:subtilase family serine protease
LGTAGNAFYNSLYEQAAAQGITVFTSSGDSGAAGCDPDTRPYARFGQQVSGLTSTPYNVSVGGTDFYMPGNASNYWNAANSSATEASAKGYIPELAWNISCADPVWPEKAAFAGMTPEQVCNNFAAYDTLDNIVAAGGGSSSCTVSDGSNASTCSAPYPKPGCRVARACRQTA